MKKKPVTRCCLVCEHSGKSFERKEDYQEVVVCPECNGAYVDLWYFGKYKSNDRKNLLVIELQDENSVPKVIYKGEEIHMKTKISFDWETRTDEYGGTHIGLEYFKKNKTANLHHKSIHHNIGKFAVGDK